jgi:hypothetical protein
MPTGFRPVARTSGLLTEQLDDELLVYDQDGQTACRLNRTASLVWENADGQRSIADLVEIVKAEVDVADEDVVLVALDLLHENGLIEAGFERRSPDEARLSRRRFIRRVGVVGTAALALPIVQSVVAPAAAAAQSVTPADVGGWCKCPCKCQCDGCGGCNSCSYCDTCACEPCDGQAGSCLYCASCDYCAPCDTGAPGCSGTCGTCYCGNCGYCDNPWYCGTCDSTS